MLSNEPQLGDPSISVNESSIKELLRKHQDSVVETFLPEELNILITSFLPWHSSSIRAQSLLVLSKFSSDIRQKYSSQSDSVATSVISRTFAVPTESRLSDTNEPSTLAGLAFLAAFFQIDWASASAIFSRDGVLESVLEAPEIYPSSRDIPFAVANLFSQASGHQSCRPLLATPQVLSWLERGTRQVTDEKLRAAAAVTLVKLTQGSEVDARSNSLDGISSASSAKTSLNRSAGADDRLVALMKELVVTSGPPSSSTLDAVEGLAYLTIQPSVKESVSRDSILLKRLVSLVPSRPTAPLFPASHAERSTETGTAREVDVGMSYGLAAIFSNLCGYKPQLSEEERQIERLKRMTKEPSQDGKLSSTKADAAASSETLEGDEHVRMRGKRLMDAGVVDALTGIIKSLGGSGEKRSISVQHAVAKTILSLVEDKINRGKILQGGGAKALLVIISASLSGINTALQDDQRSIDKLDPSDLVAIQALAKLSITSPPSAVFGPAQGSYVDAIRPLAILFIHSSASLLQRFEAIMALTNISSVSPEAAERVSAFRFSTGKGKSLVGDIVKRSETLLLDENTMIRRAATELVCNLVGGAEGSFDYFGGSPNAKSRLQILAALTDVEDLPTRLAASGALAIVTASPAACQNLAALEMERHRLLPVFVELISPEIAREYREERPDDEEEHGDPGLVHRGIVCVRNMFANLDAEGERKTMSQEAEKRGLARALIQVIKSSSGGSQDGVVLKPAAEVLKWIVESGVKLPL